MRTRARLQILMLAMATVALMAAGCSATESVTLTDTAIASATSTARQNDGAQSGGGITAENDDDDTDDDGTAITPAPDEPISPSGDPSDECRFVEIDDFGDVQIEIAYQATGLSEQEDVLLNYVVFDGTGTEFIRSGEFLEDLRPNERVRLAIDTVEDAPTDPAALDGITCEVVDLAVFDFGPEPIRPSGDDGCRFIELDSVGDIQIEIRVTSPLDGPGELAVDYALRGTDGVRFGDGIMFTGALDPGEQLIEERDTVTDLPPWLDESDVICEVLALEEF